MTGSLRPPDGPGRPGSGAGGPYDDAGVAALLGLDAIAALDHVEGADDAPVPGPADGGAAVLAAALSRRPAGSPTGPWAAPAIGPVEAFRRTVDELAELLGRLDEGSWTAPAPWVEAGWRARDVVAHLVAVERYTATLLGAPGVEFAVPDGLEGDHLALTGPTVEALRGLEPGLLATTWRAAVGRALAAIDDAAGRGRGLDTPMTFHLLPMRLRTFLVVRVFEVWAHTDDIRRAIGEPLRPPDGSRLRLLGRTAVGALPLGMALTGRDPHGRTVRVVLTGPGGGAWSQALGPGEPAGEPSALIVADVVDFCRLAARRLDASELACVIEGDAQLAADVLRAVAIFAA